MKFLTTLFTLSLTLLLPRTLVAQCNLAVDAGADILVCADDNTVRLDGFVPDGALSFEWSPTTDLSAPGSLIPLVFLDGTPRTYTLTATGFDPADNLIVNGDFEAGDSDFTTGYAPGTGGTFGTLSAEGQYAIDDNMRDTHNNFAICGDHTGGGNMMVVNGSGTPGVIVWCQTVSITPGTDYVFSAWVATAVSTSPAQLQFSINGGLIGSSFTAPNATCSWREFNAGWSAGGDATAEICIVNQNAATSGNDFAIDDLFFGEVCESTDEVNIDVITVEALAPSPLEIPCDGEVTIDASGSTSGSDVFYNWSDPVGGIITGNGTPVVTVNLPGDYVLEVVFDNGTTFCTDFITVTVTDDEPTAVAVAAVNGEVNCGTPEIQLSGIGSSAGPNWTYNWSTPDGNIVSGGNTLTPTIDAGGTYEIVVFNPVSGCTAIEVITVNESLGQPFAGINPSPGLPCGSDGILLDGSPSDFGNDITYEWITADGTIISGGEGLTPLIGSAGTYQLIAGQGSNGCTDTASITITQEANSLAVAIAVPDSVTCSSDPVELNGTGSSSGTDVDYEWTTANGNILSGANGLMPLVDEAGVYVLTVRDTETGCFTRDSVTVGADTLAPEVSILFTDSITCAQDSVLLVASGSELVSYSWTTADGEIRSGLGSDTIVAAGGGVYLLTVSYLDSGCSASDSVVVLEQLTPPVADAGDPVTFTCGTDMATLDGSNSSSGSNFAYAWTTAGGSIFSGAGTQVPVINATGDYFLEVTNTTTGCSARDTVRIDSDDQAPPVSISVVGNLDCDNAFRDLDASASASGGDYVFVWTTVGGNFVSGQNTLTPRIDAAGTYVLTVTDTVNMCDGSREVTITEAITLPAVFAGPNFRLDCRLPTDTLSGVGSDFGDPYTFNWTTDDGSFGGPNEVSNPLVDGSGTYVLTILNTETGCTDTDTVTVTESLTAPPATVGNGGEINCGTNELILGEDPLDPALNYGWTTADGSIVSGATTNQVTVDSAGRYVFLVTNPDNGCFTTDSLTITESFAAPVVDIVEPGEINCNVGTFSLDAGGSSSGPAFDLSWQTADGGNISGGTNTLTPVINAAGNYTLIITNTTNSCVDSASVTVSGNITFPVAEAGEPETLTCSDDETTLSVAGSDEGPQFTYTWVTNDGHFTGDSSSPNPEVDSAGVYYLTVRDETNNCTSVDSVVIAENFVRPPANAGPNLVLTCDSTELTLGTTAVPGLRYFWSSNNGSAVGDTDEALLTINGPGLYSLIVTNFANGCRAADNVAVSRDTVSPQLTISPVAELNCQNAEVPLAGVSDPAFNYVWTTDDGAINGSPALAEAVAGAPGTYALEVIDPDNGCRTAAMVTVVQDTASPVLNLAPAAALNCLETIRELVANDAGTGFGYVWTTTDGNLITGNNSPTAAADSAGTYVLTITNEANFCTTTDSLTVERNAIPPALSIAPPGEINCRTGQLELDATTDLDPVTANLVWSSTNGNFISGTESLTPTINSAGAYVLLLTNPENGCSSSLQVAVTDNLTPPTANLTPTVDLGCTEADFTLSLAASGQGTLTYNWATTDGNLIGNTNSSTPIINGVGTYAVTVTDDRNGCSAETEIFADQNLLEAFEFTEQLPSCERLEGTVVFGIVAGGTQPFSYSVDGGNTFRNDPVFQGLFPDNYVLVVRDGNGCELEDVATIVPGPDLQLEINTGEVINFGDSYQIDARINFPLDQIDTIRWTPTLGLDCTGCLNPRATPPETQSYRVRVESVDGCVAEGFITIIVNEENPVYFPTAFSPNGDGINDFFVPFASTQTVERITSMAIHDRWGEVVFLAEDFVPGDEPSGWDGLFKGEPLNPQVLVYSVEVEFVGGEKRWFKGDFVLVR